MNTDLDEAGEWDWADEPTTELRRTARELQRNGGEEIVAQMRADQHGLCWLCRRPLPEERHLVHVDHDHACCGPNRSCAACRRGLAHPQCNIILALAHEDMDLLRAVIASYETAQPLVRQRIAARANPGGRADLPRASKMHVTSPLQQSAAQRDNGR